MHHLYVIKIWLYLIIILNYQFGIADIVGAIIVLIWLFMKLRTVEQSKNPLIEADSTERKNSN